MMKRVLAAIRHYYLFFAALLASVIALGLQIAGMSAAANLLLASISILELGPLLAGMWRDLKTGSYGVDILAATAIITSVILGQYWAGMVIVLMLTGGEALEDYAEHRAERELDALLTKAPQKARVLRGRKEIEVRASEVHAGDKLIIRPGEMVAVDAVILEGAASFDESSLTGESLPLLKQVGDNLMSGSVNLDGPVTAKALHSAADSQYQQIIKLVKSAQNSQAPFVRMADRYAIPFTIVSFAIAGAAWIWSGEAIRFLEVIVVATPCPLILAAPIAIISGMSRGARHGIIIKTGSSLERLALVKTMAFDKTGTLTRGQLQIERLATFGNHSTNDVLKWAASLEQYSNHAQAAAITAKAKSQKLQLLTAKHVHELAGQGISGNIRGQEVLVGRASLLEDRQVKLPAGFKASKYDQTASLVAVNGLLIGVVTFADEVRPESETTLKQLRAAGLRHFLMVTGDNRRTANQVAKTLGIKQVVSEALPGDKIRSIEAVVDRPVAFVGDGVNDAPVLTASDVGVALGARGSAAASESADVVIMLDDLAHVAKAYQIAKRTFSIARQSILIGIGLSVGLMLIFATGRFLPIYGAAIQELVDVVVIFNALRAHGQGRLKA